MSMETVVESSPNNSEESTPDDLEKCTGIFRVVFISDSAERLVVAEESFATHSFLGLDRREIAETH